MKLKLAELAHIAEIIGAVAIVISLVYVGIQVNDNSRAVRSASAIDTTRMLLEWYYEIGSDPQKGKIWLRGMENPQSLNNEERFQFLMIAQAAMMSYQNAFYLEREGTLDSELRESITRTLQQVIGTPGLDYFWKLRSDRFRPDFRRFVEDLVNSRTGKLPSIYRTDDASNDEE